MSGYILLGLFAMLVFMIWYGTIADAYDEQRWLADPEHSRGGASFWEVLRWWWRR